MTGPSEQCSQCGWALDTHAARMNACKKCGSAVMIVSTAYLEKFEKPAIHKYIAQYSAALKVDGDNGEALLAMSICYLRLGLYELAERYCGSLIDKRPAEPAGYYYKAICLFRGRRPRIATLGVIRSAESLLETARELDPMNGRYDVCLAVIRHDYFVANGMRVPQPDPVALIDDAKQKHVDGLEVGQLITLLAVSDAVFRELGI